MTEPSGDREEHATDGPAVEVDRDVCMGSAECARIAPQAFDLDDAEGLVVLLDGARTTERPRLEQAARECPTAAIRLLTKSPPGRD